MYDRVPGATKCFVGRLDDDDLDAAREAERHPMADEAQADHDDVVADVPCTVRRPRVWSRRDRMSASVMSASSATRAAPTRLRKIRNRRSVAGAVAASMSVSSEVPAEATGQESRRAATGRPATLK